MNDAAKAVILAIDDEPDVLESLALTLEAAGYACHRCSRAEDALDEAARLDPDLIISDINLRHASGLELCEQIKSQPGLDDVPVMFLSGAQIPDIIRRSHAAGGVYYLRKPYDPLVLVELVDKALWFPHLLANRARAATP